MIRSLDPTCPARCCTFCPEAASLRAEGERLRERLQEVARDRDNLLRALNEEKLKFLMVKETIQLLKAV